MWQADLSRALANSGKPGTTLATFTAAAVVKQGFAGGRFCLAKQRGFGSQARYVNGGVFYLFSRYFPSKLSAPLPTTRMPINIIIEYITQAKPVKVNGFGYWRWYGWLPQRFALAARGFIVTLAEAKTLAAGVG